MRRHSTKALLCAGLLLTSSSLYADTPSSTFTPQQQTAIENIVHNYLVKNPQVLVEAAMALQQQQQATLEKQATQAIPAMAQKLFADPNSPIAGNAQGTITLVEFFDYQCPHCKDMTPVIDDLISKNKNLRVVFKQLPIFGADSVFAAKASLAAAQQGKFLAFHNALMTIRTPLTNNVVLKAAQQAGLNMSKLQKAMKSSALDQELQQNNDLAKGLHVSFTPALVIAQTQIDAKTGKVTEMKNPSLIPGAVDEEALENAINQVANGK